MRAFNRCLISCTVLMLLAVFFAVPVLAQDATPDATEEMAMTSDGMIVCSSDLILNLYVAERFFNFAAMTDMMMASGMDMSNMVDTSQISRGQFQPMFDGMMGMMNADMSMSDSMMNANMMANMSGMMMMSDADMQAQMMAMMPDVDMSGMTMLMPTMMQGEPAECTALRAELMRFFTSVAAMDMAAGMGMGMDMTATEDASMMATEEMAMDAMAFTAPLSGPQEVPGPGDDDGVGTSSVTVNTTTNEVCWTIAVQGVTLPAEAAHIHVGAVGVAGDVVVPLSAPDASGAASGCATVDAAVAAAIAADPAGHYVNVHTSDFPDGEVRGQLGG